MILLLLLLALAQQPTFRTSTVTVEVDVVVTDGKGMFVVGLTPDDFVVEEEGEPQSIDALRLVGAARALSTDNPGPTEIAAVSTAATSEPRRLVWVFDDLHTTAGGFTRARDGLVRSIETDLRPGDVGGVVVTGFSSGLQLTSERKVLLENARKLRPSAEQQSRRALFNQWPRFTSDEEASRLVAGDRQVFEAVLRRATLEEPELCKKFPCDAFVHERARQIDGAARQSAQQTLGVLQAIVNALATTRGRSAIIIASEGFLTAEMRAALDRLERTAADARVTLYAIDSRGLRESGRDITGWSQAPDVGVMATSIIDPLDGGINGLAAVTGGRVIRNQNRFDQAFSSIADEVGRYYVLAFRPTHVATQREWRQITVRVKKPGLRVAARRGYYTTAVAAAAPTAPVAPVSPAAPAAPALSPALAPAAPVAPVAPTAPAPGPAAVAALSELRETATPRRPTPRLIEDRATAAWEAFQRGDVETVRERLSGADASDIPPWALYMLGLSELALGDTARAVKPWELVRAAAPGFQPVYFDLADSYIALGDLRQALDVLRAAAARWPADAEVWNATGIVYLRRQAMDDAVSAFEKATALAPSEGLGFYNLGRALEIRYDRFRRWSRLDSSWTGNRSDLAAAIFAYERAAALGGPTAQSAAAALARLR